MDYTEPLTPTSRLHLDYLVLNIFCSKLYMLEIIGEISLQRLTNYSPLQTHPLLSEHDRRKLCKIMNCEKLSLDACVHAAQNDRLPLRTIVQVILYNPTT